MLQLEAAGTCWTVSGLGAPAGGNGVYTEEGKSFF